MGVALPASDIPACFNWNVLENGATIQAIAGVWNVQTNAGFYMGKYLQSANHAQNDEVAIGSMFLPEDAQYTAYILCQTGTNFGEMHFLLNDTDEGDIDMYQAAGGTANELESTSLGSLSAGVYSVVLKISDKNAASSDYNCFVQNIAIAKA